MRQGDDLTRAEGVVILLMIALAIAFAVLAVTDKIGWLAPMLLMIWLTESTWNT